MIDAIFWLLLGVALSGLVSVVANYYAPGINAWFDHHRSNRRLRSLASERRLYTHVLSLRDDPVGTIAYFSGRYVLLSMGAFTSVFMAIAMLLLLSLKDELVGASALPWCLLAVAIYVGVMCGLSLFLFHDTQRTSRNLYLFDRYRARLVKRWPDEEWPLRLEFSEDIKPSSSA
jgi:hypothetical protein